MSDTRISTIKIKDLPESPTLQDSDIALKDNGIITHKFKLSTLIQFIKNHAEISKYFVHQSTIDEASGIAPLDSDRKIPAVNIRYGKTAGTIYQGSEGAAVETTVNTHVTDTDIHLKSAERTKWNDKYTKNEIDNKFSTLEMATDWKESVATYTDIAMTYPNPQDGWTVNTRNTDYTYRYSGSEWVVISANAIPNATQSVDGLLTKEDKFNYDDSNAKKHTHGNKSVLDGITSVLITNWNNAFTHISDTIKHITNSERTLWNTVSNKVDSVLGKGLSTNDFTDTLKSNYDAAYTTKHTHSNKTTIDKLSETSGILMFDGKQIQGGGTDEYIHPKPARTNTTSSSSTAYGGTFSVLDIMTSNEEGHVTSVNTKTITLPAAQTSVLGSSGSCSGNSATATKATNDAYGNEIINQKTSSTEPTNQKVGDYWVKEY